MDIDNILIDGLEYVNWNRDLFEKAHAGGLTAIHATLVYWEDTKESFEKIDYWDNLIQSNSDILTHVRKSEDIFVEPMGSSYTHQERFRHGVDEHPPFGS